MSEAARVWQTKRTKLLVIAASMIALACAQAFSQTAAAQPDPKAVPTIDGGIGPCSADFAITDANGAPVYAAKVKVHIAYGFMNVRKLDLELGTNVDGKARFTGLPDRIKHGVYFYASEGNRSGEAFDDPANTCKAQFGITLREKDTVTTAPPACGN
jgi:hypothetical protein